MFYFLGNSEEISAAAKWLEENGYSDSKITPSKNAIGICTTTNNSRIDNDKNCYTYLHRGGMVGTNPHVSWTFCRQWCNGLDGFKKNVLGHLRKIGLA